MICEADQSGKVEDTQKLTIDSLIIDREYPGHEANVRNTLLALFQKNKIKAIAVSFSEIGKTSEAHKKALSVFKGKEKADVIASSVDVVNLFVATKRKPRL